MLQEFEKFALRGNVVDLAIGLTSAASEAATYDAAKKAGATLGYGRFITVTANLLIVAFVMFLVVKGMNRMLKKEQAAPPPLAPPRQEELLLVEIRDLLKARA